ncbi:alpha/beta hydrolase family protein [Streptomyces formicae]|uniref:PET hydrolase/cutinase-like domain-containing protein n=1 Tax=Streptomyces formicae TaxID=1616117 RepID=A0ABY3WEL4_9ACTN|nr:hypothetical protein [Streptomyces formicae]UNM10125.1 hypothetical protein J4032_00130 [Streptomyces formicae]
MTLATSCSSSQPKPTPAGSADISTKPGTAKAAEVNYDLGDTAFAPPGLDGKSVELKAAVTYPRKLDEGRHPMVLMLHGWGDTCQSGDKPVRAQGWPCAKDAKPVDNYLGYSYLAQALAEKGYIVVSVSANGIQAQEKNQGTVARAALLDKHLEMWKKLSTEKGPLAKLKQFSGHVDLNRVGTLGHSRGGGGVLAQALDSHENPTGVHLRAVMAFAPAMNGIDAAKDHLTHLPLSVIAGTCDAMWEDSKIPLAMAAGNPHVEHHDVTGGNHNFFNTVWTPGTGPAFATDDVAVEKRNLSGGRCQSTSDSGTPQQLKPAEQRQIAIRYTTEFFDRYLH